MAAWWGEIAQARGRIEALGGALGEGSREAALLEHLRSSEAPARDLLGDAAVGELLVSRLSAADAGYGSDELCRWLYDTFSTGDAELQLVVLRFVPAICAAYLPRASIKPARPLAGFEAVLLALYMHEYRSRQGKPVVVSIPTLAQPSLYHTPRCPPPPSSGSFSSNGASSVGSTSSPFGARPGQLSPAMEPQEAIKTTKRAAIVGAALELFHRRIASMPSRAKLEFCEAAQTWASRGCSWAGRVEEIAKLALLQAIAPGPDPTLTGAVVTVGPSSSTSIFVPRSVEPELEDFEADYESEVKRIHLPWELQQPMLRILGHCLMAPGIDQQVKDAARAAAAALYARATHELVPEAILPTRALLRLDEAARSAAATAAAAAAATSADGAIASGSSQSSGTPAKHKKPEILLTTS